MLLNLEFEIYMSSFFQTNPLCAEKLYSKVLEYSLLTVKQTNKDIILDLFCGTGTIAQIIASHNPKIKVIANNTIEC